MRAAIFDLDGTLYSGHLTLGLVRHHRTHRVNRLPLYIYMATHITMWPFWRVGLIPEAKSRDIWASHMGWTVRGWTPEQVATAADWIAEHYVAPLVCPEVLARLRAHQEAGQRVILVSGTPAPLLAGIGRRLGVEETVGTPLVLKRGRYTGACERPVCQGRGKVTRLEAYLREDALDALDAIRWEESYAYADSKTDLPLLERVGHPVAVNPDEVLAAHARQQGWEIMGAEP
jgi:HAD superfamily hydrolase (TIGR01490 family)